MILNFAKGVFRFGNLGEALQCGFQLTIYQLASEDIVVAQLEKAEKVVYYVENNSPTNALLSLDKKFEERDKSFVEFDDKKRLEEHSLGDYSLSNFLKIYGKFKISGGQFLSCFAEEPPELWPIFGPAASLALEQVLLKNHVIIMEPINRNKRWVKRFGFVK